MPLVGIAYKGQAQHAGLASRHDPGNSRLPSIELQPLAVPKTPLAVRLNQAENRHTQ